MCGATVDKNSCGAMSDLEVTHVILISFCIVLLILLTLGPSLYGCHYSKRNTCVEFNCSVGTISQFKLFAISGLGWTLFVKLIDFRLIMEIKMH